MGSGIDTDLLADLRARPTNALVLAELDIGNTTQKLSEGWAAASTGLYEGDIVRAGELTRSVSDSNFRLPRDQASIVINDRDRAREKVIMQSVGSVAGSAARLKLASRTLDQSKWFTLFTGVIDSFSSPSPLTWRFDLKRDDRPLRELVRIPYIKEYDWPNAPTESLGVPAHVVYGQHSSTATAVTGMVPTIYVDTVAFRYVVSFGPITSVEKVYVDGVESAAANWTFDGAFFRNGRWWSVIDFTSDQGDDAEVTVDCTGILDAIALTKPSKQLEHFLTNFMLGDWQSSTTSASSAWLIPSNFNIATTLFDEAESFLSDKQIAKGSRLIHAGTKGIDVLNEWTNELQIPSFWTYDGKIAIRPDDHTQTETYIASPHFRPQASPAPVEREVTFSTDNLIDEVSVEYIYSAATGDFQKQLTVKDPSKGYGAAQALQLHWRESVAA